MPYSTEISDYAVVYQWWDNVGELDVVCVLSFPLILSIATLRFQNPTLPIYVLDYSEGKWRDFPDRLGFSVLPAESYFEKLVPKKDLWTVGPSRVCLGKGALETASSKAKDVLDALDVKLTSRPFDVWELAPLLPERYIIACDCDVFWMRPLLPLANDSSLFNVRPDSLGLFYFDKTSEVVAGWFRTWQAFTWLAVHDFDFRRQLVAKSPVPPYVEANKVFSYMRSTLSACYTEMVSEIPANELLMAVDYGSAWLNEETIQEVKAFHIGSGPMGPLRGRFPLFFREMFDSLRPYFSIEELYGIFGNVIFNNSVFELADLGRSAHDLFFAKLSGRMNA